MPEPFLLNTSMLILPAGLFNTRFLDNQGLVSEIWRRYLVAQWTRSGGNISTTNNSLQGQIGVLDPNVPLQDQIDNMGGGSITIGDDTAPSAPLDIAALQLMALTETAASSPRLDLADTMLAALMESPATTMLTHEMVSDIAQLCGEVGTALFASLQQRLDMLEQAMGQWTDTNAQLAAMQRTLDVLTQAMGQMSDSTALMAIYGQHLADVEALAGIAL